jgi:hypothetical protein
MKSIMPNTVAFTAEITEDELRARLVAEVLDNIGALNDDGTTPAGIHTTCTRGEGRKGGYRITVTGPMPPRLMLPGKPT